jgi:peroxiredoxin Q/BCP
MIKEGDKAPSFNLASDSGEILKSGDFKGEWLVLYFYPKDSTPGCTREACDFSAAKKKLQSAGAKVVGVSKDSVTSHGKFRDKYSLSFPLLSDPELTLHEAYGTYGDKMMYGKKVKGTIRSTFLIDPKGKIAKAWRGVKVDGHADAVLTAIKELSKG